MSATNSERMPNVNTVFVGTQAATKTLPAMYFRKKSRIKAVHFIDQAGIAADNTNYLTLTLQDVAGAVNYATLDTRAAGQGAATAMTALALALVGAVGDVTNQPEVEVPADTNLQLVVTKNGTGVPTLAQIQIEWYPL